MVTRLIPDEEHDLAAPELVTSQAREAQAVREIQAAREVRAVDRRRPDRIETPNPHLIRIMREAVPAAGPQRDFEDEDDGVPFFGIVMGVLLSIPFWLMLAFLGWLIF